MELQNNDSIIRKVLKSEITMVVALIGCISGVIFWIVNPQNALEKQIIRLESQIENNEIVASKLQAIKDNDLHEIQLRMDRIESRQIQQLESTARIESLLKSHTE